MAEELTYPDVEVEWEFVTGMEARCGKCSDTSRLRIPGGWLYRERLWPGEDADWCMTSSPVAIAMTFIPDSAPRRVRVRRRK